MSSGIGGGGYHRVRALRCQPPPLVVSSAAQLPCVASSTPLLLSTLSSFCCICWLLSVVLPLLLVSLPLLRPHQPPCCTGIVAIVALASMMVVLPLLLLLVSLLLLHPHQRPRCTEILAIVVLASLIDKESVTVATIPVQQGRWRGHNDSKDTLLLVSFAIVEPALKPLLHWCCCLCCAGIIDC